MTGGRFVIDTSKCTACRSCHVACKQWHSLPCEDTAFTGSYQNPPDMSGANLNVVKFKEVEVSGKLKWLFFKDQCRHCKIPWCKLNCPLYAIDQLSNGIVKIDPAKCDPNACSALEEKPCQTACFFKVPKYKYVNNGNPVRTKMRKCDLCYNRLGNTDLPDGTRKPACMVACPPGTMTVGGADAMWTYAKNRALFLRTQGFPKATIYPHQQGSWGETRVLWILTDDWSLYDFPAGTYGYSYKY